MSFSRRYAKEHSRKLAQDSTELEESISPHVPAEPEPELSIEVEVKASTSEETDSLKPSISRTLSREESDQTNKSKPTFIGRLRERSERERAEEQFKRRYTHQASRLSQGSSKEESQGWGIPWKQIFFSLLFIAVLLTSIVGWRHRDSWIFPIKHIELKGDFQRVDRLALQGVLTHYASGSLLFFSASELKERLQDLPWVQSVNIKRKWPTTLLVSLTEKQAVARFGDNQLLNFDGAIFSAPNMQGMDTLPYINGPEKLAPQLWTAYQALSKLLEPYNLTIWRMEVSPRLSYTLVLNNGVTLYLGSSNVVDRLKVFAKVYEKNLKNRADQMQYADMRYNSGMAVGWKSQPKAQETKPRRKAS
ncbi:MAG: ftsQ [Gammaproteobacteria bacterium]|jgi:cell division protein FtsQ|nr:ftsQ [Gammaproteobacteria bacterium]